MDVMAQRLMWDDDTPVAICKGDYVKLGEQIIEAEERSRAGLDAVQTRTARVWADELRARQAYLGGIIERMEQRRRQRRKPRQTSSGDAAGEDQSPTAAPAEAERAAAEPVSLADKLKSYKARAAEVEAQVAGSRKAPTSLYGIWSEEYHRTGQRPGTGEPDPWNI